MKNMLLMIFTGVALFLGAMVGLLAAQGRLTYEGTRTIPILSNLFTKPADTDDAGGQGTQGDKANGDSQGSGSGQGEKRLPYRKGGSVLTGGGEDEGDGGEAGAGEHGTADSGDGASVVRKPVPPQKRNQGRKPTKVEREWAMKRNQVETQHPYPQGLFEFDKMKADITPTEFNAMVRSVREKQKQQEEMQAALNKRRHDLETQMADVLYRQQEVAKQMQQVVQERDKLNRRIEEFHKKVLLVKQDELVGLKENARNISNLDPETGRDLILSWWGQGPAGEARAIKTLSLMSRESVEAILETMETDRIRQILDKRLTLARTNKEGGNK
jgi:hypothetical protein